MNFRTALKTLLALVLGLPLVEAVLVWVSRLFESMGDENVKAVLDKTNIAIGVLWLISLVGLIVILALQNLDEPRDPEL